MRSIETNRVDDAVPLKPGDRIAKLLARAGVASRREVERMIAEGRIKRGDETITTPATILSDLAGVTVDGQPVRAAEPARLFAFHKPSGLITAERDPAGRLTIYTALRNALPADTPRLMPVGRLDFTTEGLLLLTNDGELKRAMELPSSGVPRTYRARTFGEITQARLEELIEGVTIDGMRYGKIDANMERSTGHNRWIELTLTEGKNREVRRVLEHLGLQVSRLMRLAYGPFVLGDLPRGAAGEIRAADVARFRETLGSERGTAHLGRIAVQPARALQREPARAAPPAKAARAKPVPRKREDLRLETRAPARDRTKTEQAATEAPARRSTKGWAKAKPKSRGNRPPPRK